MTVQYPKSLITKIAILREKQRQQKELESVQRDPKLKKAEAIYRTLSELKTDPKEKTPSEFDKRMDEAFRIMKESGYSLSTEEVAKRAGLRQYYVSEAFNKAGISTTFLIGLNQ